jgi:hypothetical protein
MAIRNKSLIVNFLAWDTANNAGKTGDSANITLKTIRDGSLPATAANAVTEPDASSMPGIYQVILTSGEMDGNFVCISGKSSTAGVVVYPVFIQTERGDIATLQTLIEQIKVKTDNLPSDPSKESTVSSAQTAILAAIDNNRAKIDNVATIVTTNGTKIDNVSANVNTNGAKIDNVITEVAANSTKVDNVVTVVTATSAKIDTVNAAVALNGTKIDDVSANVSANGVKIDNVITEVVNNSTKVDNVVSAVTATSAKVDTVSAAVTLNGTKIDAVSAEVTSNGGKIDTISTNVVSLRDNGISLNTKGKADVKNEVSSCLTADTISELSSPPGATPTLTQAVMLQYMSLRNKTENESEIMRIYKNDGSVLATADLSDDGEVFTKQKLM